MFCVLLERIRHEAHTGALRRAVRLLTDAVTAGKIPSVPAPLPSERVLLLGAPAAASSGRSAFPQESSTVISRLFRSRHVLAPLFGVAGFALAIAASSRASAQGDAPPAGSAAPAPAPVPPPATSSTAEDPTKKAAPPAGSTTVPGPTPEQPGQMTATPTNESSTTTITFGSSSGKKDEPASGAAKPEEKEPPLNPFAGSLLLFDQSFTKNSLDKNAQLSYVPEYEWWISPRVYYNFTKQFKIGARFDFFKEWTNAEETTYKHEWRYGDPWLSASYADKLKFISPKLKGSIGLTLRPGISKDSRGAGQYFTFGPGGSLTYAFDITGEKGKVFKTGTVGASVSYSKAFTRCTTACDAGFSRSRTNSQGVVSDIDQLRSGSLTGGTLLYALNGGLEVADGLNMSASIIYFTQFLYDLADAPNTTGAETTSYDNTRIRQFSWYLLSLDYDLLKEVTLSAGYYNLNNVLGPDGKYRNPLWSPDARIFFSVTLNLDSVYDRVRGKTEEKPATAKANSGVFNF
jgi:hypothetical protein